MIRSAFLTTAKLGKGSGGGNVAHHELLALLESTDVKGVFSATESKDYPIDVQSINPTDKKLPPNEFLWDYVATEMMERNDLTENIDMLFINGNPFGRTVRACDPLTHTIVDVPAHNLKDSMEEHKLFGIDYEKQYPHMVDDFLWEMFISHVDDAGTIICPSRYSVESLGQLVDIRGKNIRIIPHGCDIPKESEVAPLPDGLVLSHAGVFGPDKGQVYLIKAWNNLSYPDAEMIVGGLGSHYFRELIRNPAFPSKGAKYRIKGYVPDISTIYNASNVYVQPSVTEGFGLEVLEAMAYGRPVIVSDGAGASELVEDGKEGFVVPKRDVGALMERIQYFKDNPSEIEKMGTNARLKAQDYEWSKVRERYKEVFATVKPIGDQE